jgi:hypothetical protein
MFRTLIPILSLGFVLLGCGKANNTGIEQPLPYQFEQLSLEQKENRLIGYWVEVNGCQPTRRPQLVERYELRFYDSPRRNDGALQVKEGHAVYRTSCVLGRTAEALPNLGYWRVNANSLEYSPSFREPLRPVSFRFINDNLMEFNGRTFQKESHDPRER